MFQPHAACVTRNVCDVNGSLYRDSNQSRVRLQIGAGVFGTASVVGTAEHYIVGLRSLPKFPETISQGYRSTAQRPLACNDKLVAMWFSG